jgi:hypothetical protein
MPGDWWNYIFRGAGYSNFQMGNSTQANGNAALAEVLDGPDKSFSSEPMALEGSEANGAKEGPDDYYGA